MFVALPFCVGLLSVLIYTYHQGRTLGSCLAVSMISLAMVSLALLSLAIEGVFCIIMALPIAAPLALLGGLVGFLAQRHPSISTEAPSMMILLMLVPPGVMSVETTSPLEAPRTSVRTSIRTHQGSVGKLDRYFPFLHGRRIMYSGTAVLNSNSERTSLLRIRVRTAACTALLDKPVSLAIVW